MSAEKLSPQQRDRLTEITRGGLEQAAVTLRMMLGGEVELRVSPPSLRTTGVSVRLGMSGAVEGGIFIDLPEHLAAEVVKKLTAGQETSLLDETARSALMELGNVLASVFAGYFDQRRGLRTLPTPPQLSLVPLEIPEFDAFICAELTWSECQQSAEVLIGLERSAVDILLA